MNPYLRIDQPIRPSAFFYARQILQAKWPEMEPVSSMRPIPRAEVLEAEPIGWEGSAGTNLLTALATIGLFFDDELIAKAVAAKWLMADDHFFRYGSYKEAVERKAPETKREEGKGFRWEGSEGFWWREDPTDAVLDMWINIEQRIIEAADAWEPPAPTSVESATPVILDALHRQPSIASFSVPHPSYRSSGVGITYGIWTDPFPRREPPFPIFAVRREEATSDETHPTLYFKADEAVLSAYAMISERIAFPKDFSVQPAINTLQRLVQTLITRRSQAPPSPWVSAWD